MVENRPLATLLSHAVLLLGVLVVAFPIYVAFTASTQTLQDVVQAPMPLLPGAHLLDNYGVACRPAPRSSAARPYRRCCSTAWCWRSASPSGRS